MFGYTEIHCIW